MQGLIALASGLLFGAGLVVSGMTDTAKVLGFLDLFGRWNPALMFVMGTALLVTVPVFALARSRAKPVLAQAFQFPATTTVDRRVLMGAAIFGLGWGLYGYCPGPAIVSLVYLRPEGVLFIGAMLVGMWLASRLPAPSR